LQAIARKRFLSHLFGKYVAFLDSDDLWFPNHLANQIAIFESDPALGLVYANGVHIRNDQPVGVSFDRTPQSLPVNLDSLLREQSTSTRPLPW
jgi:teichuronic acid biosynthesis glycosyltransferase TuaG